MKLDDDLWRRYCEIAEAHPDNEWTISFGDWKLFTLHHGQSTVIERLGVVFCVGPIQMLP